MSTPFRILTLLLALGVRAAHADLAVDAPVHDFGRVDQGAVVEHVFRVRNVGPGHVEVLGVKGSCACTVGVATGAVLPPGDESWVAVRLDTSRITGRTTKTVVLHTTDPAHGQAVLTLTGDVATDVVVEPSALYLGRLRRGTWARRAIAVRPGRPDVAHVATAVTSSDPSLRAWIEDAPDGSGRRVVVEPTRALPRGRFNAELTIHTTGTAQSTVTVPVFASVEGY